MPRGKKKQYMLGPHQDVSVGDTFVMPHNGRGDLFRFFVDRGELLLVMVTPDYRQRLNDDGYFQAFICKPEVLVIPEEEKAQNAG